MAEGFDIKGSRIEEISEKELKYGYWFVSHKAQLQLALRVFLISLSIAFYGYAVVRLAIIYAVEQPEYEQSLQTAAWDYINIAGVHEASRIQDLQVLSRDILSLGDGKIDIVARVRNPNTKWALSSFEYRFAVGSRVYDAKESFFLPGEEKFLMLLNVEGAGTGTPQLFIDEPQWKRVVQYETWGPERLKFAVTEKQFIAARQGEISGQLQVSEVRANIQNNSAYNYNEVIIQIGLYTGSRLVAVNQVPLPDFLSGQKRPIVALTSTNLPTVTTVEIIPTVLILEPEAYKDFRGEFESPYLES